MLSYRHSFHSGNHADVLKHIVLSLIISTLNEKEKPYLYLDTHAGAGRYLLSYGHAERTREYLEGITRIWQHDNRPTELGPYIRVVQNYNPRGKLRYYPGSPLIAGYLLREHDQIYLSELHSRDFPMLCNEFQKDNRAHLVRANGYQQLKSKLPPTSRRGLILIDPPYEMKSDYQTVVKCIKEGHSRFGTGVFALWYPVVFRQQIKRMINALKATGIRRILQIELGIRPDNDHLGMTASGMIIINPPWKLEQQMNNVLPWLQKVLVQSGTGHYKISWIVPE